MNDDQIKHMVNRFLGWKLPENFNPDGGISFEKTFSANPIKNTPTGTNVFDANQTEEMVRYMIEGMPVAADPVAPLPRYLRRYLRHNGVCCGSTNSIWRSGDEQDCHCGLAVALAAYEGRQK